MEFCCKLIKPELYSLIYFAGSSIGIGDGSGAGFLLFALIAFFATQKYKHRRAQKLKQKFFQQNRGQLLQQLVSQRANIAERMIITVDELKNATNNFDKSRELGSGGHEVPLLVYEFISNGTLYQHLHVDGPRSLPWNLRLRIAAETAKAIAYLHSSVSIPIIHRDIKSSNILLDYTMTSKVSDFGASRYIPVDKTGLTTRVQGTIEYLDPTYFYMGRLTDKSDVYSFGIILVELLTKKKPFSYLSQDGKGLGVEFVNLLTEDNLDKILDPQVMEEGAKKCMKFLYLQHQCIN
uniref:Protein kinase domain-containing protein n=1 Tax=Leersia perrieri TaxID=77586 RepID=A0A0D9XS83_9ORYZ